MAVDTVIRLLFQGSVKSFTYAKDQNDITLTNLSTGKSTTYDISSKAAIRFNGEDIALKELERNSFATLQLSGGDVVTLLDAYPGSTTTEGVIESITYGTPTTLAVKTANDSVMTFELDLTDLPAIYRDGKSSSLDKIKSGDTVVVTVRYNKVTTLETTPQSANVTGTITRVVQDAAGITFDVKLTDGSTASYTVSEGVSDHPGRHRPSPSTPSSPTMQWPWWSAAEMWCPSRWTGAPAPAASLRARSWCPTPRTRP